MSFLSFEELLDEADDLKLSRDVIRSAIFDLDATDLQSLIQACMAHDDQYLYDHYVFHITERAEALNDERSFAAMRLILANDNKDVGHPPALLTLAKLKPQEKVLPILREALNDSYHGTYRLAAEILFQLAYKGNIMAALDDENAHLRLTAIKATENINAVAPILKALKHEDLALRRYAAWYSGRRKVHEAFELLLQGCQRESDFEALRAMIWALGVLRHSEAKAVIARFLEHPEALIVQGAKEALGKLD